MANIATALLDRDGVITRKRYDYIKSWASSHLAES